ncbi:MAG: hypothetical protein ACXABY_30420, partial [Candidatus Thorarchaeota archaeon]
PLGFNKLKPGGQVAGVAGLFWTLQNFTFATLHMYARLTRDAYGVAKDDGFKQMLKSRQGKAAIQALGTQAFLAGAMGMPLAGSIITILEEMFGTEIYSEMRQGLADMGGDDEELGNFFATLALEGAPTAFLPVDVQSRFGLGSIGALSSYNGFDINNIFGATGGVVENLYGGLTEAMKGNLAAGAERAAPSAFKRSINLMRNDGNIHDMKGEKLMDPSAFEAITYMAGFQPKDLAKMRQQKRLMQKSDTYASAERKQDLTVIADLLTTGDTALARKHIEAIAEASPGEDADDIVNAVTRLAIQRTLPADPGSGGTKANIEQRREISQSFGGNQDVISAQQKGDLKRAFKSQLSGRPRFASARTMMTERLIDNIRGANSSIGETEARLIAERQLTGR